MRVVFFNGPPRSGKDTAAEWVGKHFQGRTTNFRHAKLSARLKVATHGLYGIMEWDGIAPADYFEECKDEPREEFEGLTPRAAYIAVAERYLFPVHGREVLGRWLADELREGRNRLACISDLGRDSDAFPILERAVKWDKDRALIVRMERAGCEWDNRVPVEISGVRLITVRNDGTVDELRAALRPVIEWARQE